MTIKPRDSVPLERWLELSGHDQSSCIFKTSNDYFLSSHVSSVVSLDDMHEIFKQLIIALLIRFRIWNNDTKIHSYGTFIAIAVGCSVDM